MAISLSCNNPPRGAIGQPYDHFLLVTGAPEGQPIKFVITSGSLPPGLSLNPDTGEISGTPTASGTWSFQISVDVIRAAIVSSILNVTTDEVATLIWPSYEDALVSSNGIQSMFKFLYQLSQNGGTDRNWAKTTNSIDVISGVAVTAHPELAFNPANLSYPVGIWITEGVTFSPQGVAELHIYDVSMDVVREDAATGTLVPRDYRVDYGTLSPADSYAWLSNPQNAIDGDLSTYATIHRENKPGFSGGPLGPYPYLEVGAAGWYAPGDSASIRCSITIAGRMGWLDLWVWRQLFALTGTDQQLAFPPGYEQALKLQLAAEFARQYPGRDLAKVRAQLARAIARIDAANVSNSQAIEELPPEKPNE